VSENLANEPVVFPLRGGRGSVALHAGGFRYPSGFGRERFVAYADLTHLAIGSRALRIGARSGVVVLPRSHFREPAAADALARTLVARVAAEPGGSVQLARMAEIEEMLRVPVTPWVTRVLVIACVAAFALELGLGPVVHHAGFLNSALAMGGEPWRLFTANLLHADGIHLGLNMLGLAIIGSLVERMLGSARTAFIAGLSALGATVAGLVMGYEALVGASGIVTGLFGALLWIELRHPDRLPATWRIPRRVLWTALVLQGLLDWSVPFIAGASHIGGLLAGMLAAALATGPGLRREPLAPALRMASALIAVVAAASIVSAARIVLGGSAIESHAARLLDLEGLPAQVLNDAAWLIATGRDATRPALDRADELAERAVSETDRMDPNMLDTLAEVQFQRGDAQAAVETIDEAIALAPEVAYFREQRRRFEGERARDDRPEPPDPFEVAPRRPEPPRHAPANFDRDTPGIDI